MTPPVGGWVSGLAPLEIVLSINNKVGALAEVTQALAEAGVNVTGLTLGRHPDRHNLRLIVDKPAVAIAALALAGYKAKRNEVHTHRVHNRPGAIAAATQKLAKHGINVEAVFLSAKTSKGVDLVFQVDDVEAARRALRKPAGED